MSLSRSSSSSVVAFYMSPRSAHIHDTPLIPTRRIFSKRLIVGRTHENGCKKGSSFLDDSSFFKEYLFVGLPKIGYIENNGHVNRTCIISGGHQYVKSTSNKRSFSKNLFSIFYNTVKDFDS